MSQIDLSTSRPTIKIRWLVWFAYAVVWTMGLLLPLQFAGDLPITPFNWSLRLLVSKTLHILAYAGLAWLTAWLAVPRRWRWVVVFFLMFHASTTELLQVAIPGRSGSLVDVLLNQIGIVLGLVLAWRNWTSPTNNDIVR